MGRRVFIKNSSLTSGAFILGFCLFNASKSEEEIYNEPK
jgi:hypothetical protein